MKVRSLIHTRRVNMKHVIAFDVSMGKSYMVIYNTLFLASEVASFSTGSEFVIDGSVMAGV